MGVGSGGGVTIRRSACAAMRASGSTAGDWLVISAASPSDMCLAGRGSGIGDGVSSRDGSGGVWSTTVAGCLSGETDAGSDALAGGAGESFGAGVASVAGNHGWCCDGPSGCAVVTTTAGVSAAADASGDGVSLDAASAWGGSTACSAAARGDCAARGAGVSSPTGAGCGGTGKGVSASTGCDGTGDGVSASSSDWGTAGVLSGATPGVLAISDSRKPS